MTTSTVVSILALVVPVVVAGVVMLLQGTMYNLWS